MQYFLSKAQLKAPDHPDLTTYKQHTTSYAGSALWDITPNHRLSLTYSHNGRIPSPMGCIIKADIWRPALLSMAIKLGQRKSDNYELGFMHTADKVSYKASTYYSNFDNYILMRPLPKKAIYTSDAIIRRRLSFYGVEVH